MEGGLAEVAVVGGYGEDLSSTCQRMSFGGGGGKGRVGVYLVADGEAESGGDVDCYDGSNELTAIETWQFG